MVAWEFQGLQAPHRQAIEGNLSEWMLATSSTLFEPFFVYLQPILQPILTRTNVISRTTVANVAKWFLKQMGSRISFRRRRIASCIVGTYIRRRYMVMVGFPVSVFTHRRRVNTVCLVFRKNKPTQPTKRCRELCTFSTYSMN
jgi:hypothetical protein